MGSRVDRLQQVQLTGSVVWCMWDLPGPGIESTGRWIFTTEPLGKPEKAFVVVVLTDFMFLFHNDTGIDLGNVVNLNNS